MGAVLAFTGKRYRDVPDDDLERNGFLLGYAAAIADVYRNSGQDYASEILLESGMTLEEFEDAGIEDYDLKTITKIYKQQEKG